MKKNKQILILSFLFAICLCVFFYPFISNQSRKKINTQTTDYSLGNEEIYNNALLYNENLVKDISFGLKEKEYENVLNLNKSGLMGYIEIPKIQIIEPIYHYTSDEVLDKGIGHLFGTSLPVGGKNSHCLLTGHSGLPTSKLFTDLDQMSIGDTFYIHTCKHILSYKVYEIKIVSPEENPFKLKDNIDLITLVTCTPYGINTHRLLVTGKRTKLNNKEKENEKKKGNKLQIQKMFKLKNIIVLCMIAFVFAIIIYNFNDNKKGG